MIASGRGGISCSSSKGSTAAVVVSGKGSSVFAKLLPIPVQSSFLPAAGGEVAHFRIQANQRTEERARYFHEIQKEKVV